MSGIRLSNIWENFEEFMESVRSLEDPTLIWWFTDRLRTLQSESFPQSNWRDLSRTILLNFKNDEAFRNIFNGYSSTEKTEIAKTLSIPINSKEPDRGLPLYFKDFEKKVLSDNWGQEYLGTVFGFNYSSATNVKSLNESVKKPIGGMVPLSVRANMKGVEMARLTVTLGLRLIKACKASNLPTLSYDMFDLVSNGSGFALKLSANGKRRFKVISLKLPNYTDDISKLASVCLKDILAVKKLNENQVMVPSTGKSQQTANANREGNDQYGICSVCHSELVNDKQAKIGLCDECK
jgi:hypothetical protein